MVFQRTREPPVIELRESLPRSTLAPASHETTRQLRDIHRQATRMRPQEWLEARNPAELRHEVVHPLSDLLGAAIAALRSVIPKADEEPDADEVFAAFDEAWEFDGDREAGTPPASDAVPATSTRVPDMGDIAFTAQLELSDAATQLREKARAEDPLQIAVECDRARRKLRRCIEAVVCAAPAASPPSMPPGIAGDPVRQAILVRTAYTRFRRSIPRCDPDDPDAVFQALRTAANAISKLLGGPAFEHVRHSDRAMLRALQERIVTWARSPAHHEGVRLHQDFVTCADLLRGINKRQELQVYDDDTIASLRGRLEMRRLPCEQRAELFDELKTLFGRDDELDERILAMGRIWDEAQVEALVCVLDRLVPSTRLFPCEP